MTAGIVITVTALFGLAAAHSEVWHLAVGKVLISLANGLCVTALVTRTALSVDRGDTGIATSLLLVTRVVGYAVGVQLSGAILTAGTPPGSDVPAESAFVTGFVTADAVTALSLLIVRTRNKGVRECPAPIRRGTSAPHPGAGS